MEGLENVHSEEISELSIATFVLVKFTVKKLIGRVIVELFKKCQNNEITSKFLMRSSVLSWADKPKFLLTENPETCIHSRKDIVMILPPPLIARARHDVRMD